VIEVNDEPGLDELVRAFPGGVAPSTVMKMQIQCLGIELQADKSVQRASRTGQNGARSGAMVSPSNQTCESVRSVLGVFAVLLYRP
jgi:hypothetical protein